MKKFIIGGIIIAAISIMIIINVINNNNDGTKGLSLTRGRAQSVEAEVIKRDTITSSILITGAVEVITKKDVLSTTPLKVLEVLVTVGDSVKKGDQLFSADLETMTKELTQLKINLDIQKLTKEKLESLSVAADDGAMVVAVQMAKLSVDSAQRFFNTQTANLEKNQLLFDSGVISAFEMEGIQSSVVEAESQLTSAKLNYQRSQADLSSVRKSNNTSELSTEIDLEIQEMNLDSLQMSIDTLEEQIAEINALTVSPSDGVITGLNIHDNETTSSMTPLVVVTDTTELKIAANIREYDVGDVAVGQEVLISGDAINKGQEVTGMVSYIAPIAAQTMVNNRQVTAIEVEMTVETGAEYLKPGYTTECEIITSKLENVVIASYDMLRKDEDNNDILFVIGEENIAEERRVELGTTSDFDAEVISGLEDGEMVIINPSLSLFDGTKVEIITEEEGK